MNKFLKNVALTLSAVTMVGTMSAFGGCFTEQEPPMERHYSVYAPDGAPALALVNAIDKNGVGWLPEDSKPEFADWLNFNVVDASTITTYVTGEAPKADFAILPVNAASKLLGTGENYKMLGTVTNGNMYFLTTNGAALTNNSLNTLIGKTVGVVQLTNVPGLTLQAVLNKAKLPYQILENDTVAATDKINLKAVDAATGVTPAGGCDYYLCPEPAAATKVAKTEGKLKFAGDLQSLYGENGYPQAVAVAKVSVLSHEGCMYEVLSYLQNSYEFLSSVETKEAIKTIVGVLDRHRTEGLTPAFTEENLTPEVISHCAVKFTPAQEDKARVNAFLQELIEVNPTAAKAVSDNFFYNGK